MFDAQKSFQQDFAKFRGVPLTALLATAHLQLDDVVRDGCAAVALRQRPVEVAVVGPPVQDVGPPGLGRLVCTRGRVDIRC